MEHQQPDAQPGFYYVTVRRDTTPPTYRTLRGPFINDHASALGAVDEAMRRAMDYDPRGCWYAYGTCRSEVDLGPGFFDKLDAKVARPADRSPDPRSPCREDEGRVLHDPARELAAELGS
jgi:hypothetical protein